jgi:hypothetical protein
MQLFVQNMLQTVEYIDMKMGSVMHKLLECIKLGKYLV